jgi:hypothetical protein
MNGQRVGELLLAAPTGIFTVGLVFCLAWWLSSFLFGGFDGGDDVIPVRVPGRSGGAGRSAGTARGTGRSSAGRSGAGRFGAGRGRGSKSASRQAKASRAGRLAAVPASLRWTVGVTCGWITSLVLAATARGLLSSGSVRTAVLVGVGVLAALASRFGSRTFSSFVSPMFVTSEAPTRASLVGAIARVRSMAVDDQRGEAKVTNGSSAGAIVSVRADAGQFHRGDLVQLIAYEPDAEAFMVADVDASLLDEDISVS